MEAFLRAGNNQISTQVNRDLCFVQTNGLVRDVPNQANVIAHFFFQVPITEQKSRPSLLTCVHVTSPALLTKSLWQLQGRISFR